MFTALDRHYCKHHEDKRLLRRHGIVEFIVTMSMIQRALAGLQKQAGERRLRIADIGCGTGRYATALWQMGYDVDCVEFVQHNIAVMCERVISDFDCIHTTSKDNRAPKRHVFKNATNGNEAVLSVCRGDARQMPWLGNGMYDIVLMLGPLYHLIGDDYKSAALTEGKRILQRGGCMFVAYLMNEYSILSYCFQENRIADLIRSGNVDENFHVQTPEGELYDYVRIDDIDRLNRRVGLVRQTIFSPEGPADYMRTKLNQMNDDTFELFVQYCQSVCELKDIIGAGSHVVDVVLPVFMS